jgi:MFS transporter, ACS family, glucarate transporter
MVTWLFVLSAVAYLDRVNLSISGSAVAQTYGLDHQTLGFVFSAFVLGYMLFQAPCGRLADRWGARRTLTLAVVWWALFTTLTAAVPAIPFALPALLAIRFLLGAGEAAMYPASNRIVAAWIPPADRGRANGIIFMGVGLGASLAPPLVTTILVRYGWRMSFFVCAALGLIAGIIWFLLARDSPAGDDPTRDRRRDLPYRPAPSPPVVGSPVSEAIPWHEIAMNRTVVLLTLSYFCYGYAAYIFFTWFFIYLNEVRGMDLAASARFAMLPFLAMALGSLAGGVLSDALVRRVGMRAGRCGVAAGGIAIAAACIGAGTHLASARAVSVVLAGGAGALYLAQSAFWSVSADIAGPSAGAVSGLMNMGAQLGGVVTASLTPWIAIHYGWSMSFAVAGALCVLGALAWLAIRPDRAIRVAAAISLAAVTACSGTRHFALEANDARFWQLVPHDTKLSTIATGFGFTEGPVWDTSNVLYVSDEVQDSIYRITMDGHKQGLIHLGDPDGNTFDLSHRLIDGASVLRAVIAVSPSGRYSILADHYDNKRFNSPNDVVIGPDGALYFTDPTLDLPKGQSQEIPFQGVYRLDALGNVTLLTKDLVQPNGLAFTPDGKTLYIDDSDTGQRNIRAYDVMPNGTLSNGRIFGTEPGGPTDGVPDGMRLDVDGNMFVTGPRGIWVWDAHGHHLGTIAMPEQPANLTWGDRDYGTLYITATTSVYRLRTTTHGFVPYRGPETASALPCAVTGPTEMLSLPHVATAPRLTTDPRAAAWSHAAVVRMDKDCSRLVDYPKIATSIHGFWTDQYLYLLFECPYETLNLWLPATNDRPRPHLWDRDVVEVFLGDDWQNIRHYREFEIAPTADWIDLAIDLDHPAEDYTWRSGWQTTARIDQRNRIWYAAARIPLPSISTQPVAVGTRWRLNLYRIDGQGSDAQRHFLCWQPTCTIYHDPNHVPEHFGTLVFAQ